MVGRRDYASARKVYEESLALWQSIGNKRNVAFSMGRIGLIVSGQRDYATARWYVEQSLRFARETEDRTILSTRLNSLGEIERVQGKYDSAKKYYLEALEIAREIGRMELVIICMQNLGFVFLHEGNMDMAKSLFAESLAPARELNRQPQIACGLMGFAGILAVQHKAERAAQLLAVIQTFLASGDVRTWNAPDEQAYQHYLTLTREQLDDSTFNTAWAEGQKMAMEQATEYALENVK